MISSSMCVSRVDVVSMCCQHIPCRSSLVHGSMVHPYLLSMKCVPYFFLFASSKLLLLVSQSCTSLLTREFIALVPLIASCDGSRLFVKWCVCPGTHCTPAAVRDCYYTHNNGVIFITNHLLQTPDLTASVMLHTSLKLTPPACFLLQAKSPLQTGQHKPKVRDGLRPVRSTSLQPDTISIYQAIRTQILLKNRF